MTMQRRDRSWQQEELEDERWYEDEPEEQFPRRERVEQIVATNRTVLLTCTLAAMLPPLALFLLYAEKKSRAIRHFAVQSMGLTVCHLLLAGVLVLVDAIVGGIPYIGFLMNLILWIVYIACAIVMLILRVRMMAFAYRGARFSLPLVGRLLDRFNEGGYRCT